MPRCSASREGIVPNHRRRVPVRGYGASSHISHGGAMAHSIDHLIVDTPKGVKIDLKTLYVYPDGHANLTFSDGTNWPVDDEYQLIQLLAGALLRPMKLQARRK